MSLANIVLSQIQKTYPNLTGAHLKAITRGEVETNDPKVFDCAQEYALAHLLDINTSRRDEGREELAQKLDI